MLSTTHADGVHSPTEPDNAEVVVPFTVHSEPHSAAGAHEMNTALLSPEDQEDPEELATKSDTRYGVWAHNMGLGCAASLLILAVGDFILLAIDRPENEPPLPPHDHIYIRKSNTDLWRVLAGIYCLVLGVGMMAWECRYGTRNTAHSRFPWRGLTYVALSILPLFTIITSFGGPLIMTVAVGYFMSFAARETYNLQPHSSALSWVSHVQSVVGGNRITAWFRRKRNEGRLGHIVFLTLYVLANLVMFIQTVVKWLSAVEKNGLTKWVPIAKGFGALLDLNCVVILLPVCRTFIRILYNHSTRMDNSLYTRSLKLVMRFVPLDSHLGFHKLCAVLIVVFSVGHVVAHVFNYAYLPDKTIAGDELLEGFGLWPFITGGLIMVVMLILYAGAMENVKRLHFELFWYSHYFFVLFYFFNLIHGRGAWGPNFWKYLILPGAIYVAERIAREVRSRRFVYVQSVTFMRPDMMCVEFTPPFGQDYKEGQFVFLKCGFVSNKEWHPFTISSAPDDPTATIHIRVLSKSSWTYQLKEYLLLMGPTDESHFVLATQDGRGVIKGKSHGPDGKLILQIDGPHAAPTQRVQEYQTVMLVGAGIGMTPMAATLRSLLKYRWRSGYPPYNVHFVWLLRHSDIIPFEWFLHMLKQLEDEVHHLRYVSPSHSTTLSMHIYVTSIPGDLSPGASVFTVGKADDFGIPGRDGSQSVVDGGVIRQQSAPFTTQELFDALYSPQEGKQLGDITVHRGRPEWSERFDYVQRQHPSETSVGVCFCGPHGIGDDLRAQCIRMSETTSVKFRLHSEVF